MTDREAAMRIITWWRAGWADINQIQDTLKRLYGRPLSRSDILFVIRSWVDRSTENKDYNRRKREIGS